MNLGALPRRFAVDAIKVAPKGLYTRAVGWGARQVLPRSLRRSLYGAFARWVGARLDEVELPLDEYPSFDSFFSRRLRAGVREDLAAPEAVVAPCDGMVAACGAVEDGQLWQAKGHHFRLEELLADGALARQFAGGSYVTIYLAPRDYHRVHSPIGGDLLGYRYLPGRLLPVSAPFVSTIPNLFSRNERVVFDLMTFAGPVCVVMVGAVGVGNISTTHSAEGLPAETRHLRGASSPMEYSFPAPVPVARGAELGAFHLGSTVILLLPKAAKLVPSEPRALQLYEKIAVLPREGSD